MPAIDWVPELEPTQLVLTGLAAGYYATRARTLSRRGRPVPVVRQVCFYGGLATILLALLTPIGRLADDLLSVHMVEHLLMGDIGALLLVIGLTGPMLAPILRLPGIGRLRVIANPLIALPLWLIDLYCWHLPFAYQAALENSTVHGIEHTCFIFFGANMWMCLFGPLPMPRWFGNLGKLFYIVAVRLGGTILANIFLWSGTLFYPFYSAPTSAWHVNAVTDQRMAGGIMMVEESILTICLFAWLFMRAAREWEQRDELLDFARDNGLELTPERAGRAVAAGRGEELRRRLEDRLRPTQLRPG